MTSIFSADLADPEHPASPSPLNHLSQLLKVVKAHEREPHSLTLELPKSFLWIERAILCSDDISIGHRVLLDHAFNEVAQLNWIAHGLAITPRSADRANTTFTGIDFDVTTKDETVLMVDLPRHLPVGGLIDRFVGRLDVTVALG